MSLSSRNASELLQAKLLRDSIILHVCGFAFIPFSSGPGSGPWLWGILAGGKGWGGGGVIGCRFWTSTSNTKFYMDFCRAVYVLKFICVFGNGRRASTFKWRKRFSRRLEKTDLKWLLVFNFWFYLDTMHPQANMMPESNLQKMFLPRTTSETS